MYFEKQTNFFQVIFMKQNEVECTLIHSIEDSSVWKSQADWTVVKPYACRRDESFELRENNCKSN